jgi:hypothetical protein|tara:strand:- start:11258 stop:12235 length:978 start_codon:yes stop_codon:yes gene_type:complete
MAKKENNKNQGSAEKKVLKGNNKRQGVNNTDIDQDAPFLNVAQNEKTNSDPSGRTIVILGAGDKPGSTETGYGGRGGTKSSRIHIPVGLASSKDFDNNTIYSPNNALDGATIYVSEKTDIDANFGCADDGSKSKAKSGMALKADHNRLIGRESVKIVTGRAPIEGAGSKGETNARGGRIDSCGQISLIAGNFTEHENTSAMSTLDVSDTSTTSRQKLQPLVKGDDMVKAMGEMAEILSQVLTQVSTLNSTLGLYTQLEIGHIHFVGPIPTTPSPVTAAAATAAQIQVNVIKAQIANIQTQISQFKINYLEEIGSNYVNSKHVKTT